MNAFKLYEAVFDQAREEYQGTDLESMVADIIEYADGAFGKAVEQHEAETLAECAIDFEDKTWSEENGNGEYENNYFVCVKDKLQSLEF